MSPDTNQVYGISFMCRFMKVSRAAYYKWIHRTPSKRALEDKEILKYVKIIEEEKRIYPWSTKINDESSLRYNISN